MWGVNRTIFELRKQTLSKWEIWSFIHSFIHSIHTPEPAWSWGRGDPEHHRCRLCLLHFCHHDIMTSREGPADISVVIFSWQLFGAKRKHSEASLPWGRQRGVPIDCINTVGLTTSCLVQQEHSICVSCRTLTAVLRCCCSDHTP